MDVRDALSRCEDPTLGWSLQFWVTIADPLTHHVFFACPASGQCSWDPPVGAFVVPRSPDGEWWELADTTRKNRSYYYNTLTSKTQWTRPGGDAFVIPLGLIQKNALPPRPDGSDVITPSKRQSRLTPRKDRASVVSPLRMPSTHVISQLSASASIHSQDTIQSALGDMPSATHFPEPQPYSSPARGPRAKVASSTGALSPPQNGFPPRSPLVTVDEGSGTETDRSDGSGWWGRRKSNALTGILGSPLKGRTKKDLAIIPLSDSEDASQGRSPPPEVSPPIPIKDSQSKSLPNIGAAEPIFVESRVRTKRLSTGWHPLLPADISKAIQSFQGTNSAHKYFATQRSGVLRQKVPLERIMEWQKSPISSPLLVLSRARHKDALNTFKVIQHVMGERDRHVEGAKVVHASSSSRNLAQIALGRNKNVPGGIDGGAGRGKGAESGNEDMNEKMVVLQEIRWLIQLAVSNGEMRDEVYCQLVKQLTKNPDRDSVVLGFQLFCVLVNAFGPSQNFESFVQNFLKSHVGQEENGVGVMADYCLSKLQVMATQGGRGRVLTVGEIEHASDGAFYPSVYGESLDRIMDLQERSYPDAMVPVILPFLAERIVSLGGMECEGIFRIPGDGDSVSELRSRMDRGHYQLQGIDDPHVAASLYKLWLRELEEPVVPTNMYNDALSSSRTPSQAIAFVSTLPTNHKRVLIFVISFAQVFLRPEVVERTKMNAGNLARVLAPNILRTTSSDLTTVYTNATFEAKFILHLLEHLNCRSVDSEYKGYVLSKDEP
ncbi:hypothetical protein TREMEDRAFT_38591 [Tremella mesenterica DSM 1558]|uniref:uncharacterized protein n=1 Tax=Tremella mesenterica (strain ATCC 24925 / CBS 8224 / DSM 1558 / NBRC 9311 / NRRL Y-6157 / RJB 2259-6 / UBC 559-6) TaxID=578456 RepID=UPI0003F49E0C|nr:uncharacterized protein TREMEDRAFT_38591 [Tremella mesenterica DSM 1558]EIW69920.1 hypothetical protein TREMEDRAFT_38591 [Tremella mesenterica DSM 1558]